MSSDGFERSDLDRAAAQLETFAATVSAAVAEIAEFVHIAAQHDQGLGLDSLNAIQRVAERHLGGRASSIWGLGFVGDPSAFPDRGGLQWWCRSGPGGAIRRLVVSLDQSALDFYDYTAAAWFEVARDGELHVTGPYVDATGTNEYIVTFSRAVSERGRFLGVAAADVLVGTLQSVMQPTLRAIRGHACLVDADGLVIATNTPDLLASTVRQDAREDDVVVPVPWAGWRLTVRSDHPEPTT